MVLLNTSVVMRSYYGVVLFIKERTTLGPIICQGLFKWLHAVCLCVVFDFF